eukprot:SAG11_NODE_8663_length_989_cov_2.488764_1_plen_45_part_01
MPWWRDDAYYGDGRWQGTQALDGGGAVINQARPPPPHPRTRCRPP